MLALVAPAFAAAALAGAFPATLTPIELDQGVNQIPNIAGDGEGGSISVDWRANGNAWGYRIFMVRAGGSIVTVDGQDRFTDQPHTEEDVVTSVRFARGRHDGLETIFALVADRTIAESVPAPARTTIRIYVLRRNDEPLGTPYHFLKLSESQTKRGYCNADMALKTEMGFPLPRDYSGPRSLDGC